MTTGYSTILFETSGAVARITFNRPEARNSLTGESAADLYDAFLRVSQDPAVKVLVLRGKGGDFCPGADVKAFNASDEGGDEVGPGEAEHFKISVLLRELPVFSIAAIQGGCAGAGFGLACACDMRVADTSARFNTAFFAVGVAGDMALPWILPRLIGAARARDLNFFPRKFLPEEALAMGLVARVFAPADFDVEVEALVDRLAKAAPLALRTLKSNYIEAERMPLDAYVAMETERHLALFRSEDRAEAFAAYVEKRAPHFKGR